MNTKAVGERIRIAREERCMTQMDLSKAIGCTPQHVSAIERGIKTPTRETFVSIASALRVPANVLLQEALPEDNLPLLAPISDHFAYLQTYGYQLAYAAGIDMASKLLPHVVLGFSNSI